LGKTPPQSKIILGEFPGVNQRNPIGVFPKEALKREETRVPKKPRNLETPPEEWGLLGRAKKAPPKEGGIFCSLNNSFRRGGGGGEAPLFYTPRG